jgi:hypothetical protein
MIYKTLRVAGVTDGNKGGISVQASATGVYVKEPSIKNH